jgi:hypothetical protein
VRNDFPQIFRLPAPVFLLLFFLYFFWAVSAQRLSTNLPPACACIYTLEDLSYPMYTLEDLKRDNLNLQGCKSF